MRNAPILETPCNKVKIPVSRLFGVGDDGQTGVSGEYGSRRWQTVYNVDS